MRSILFVVALLAVASPASGERLANGASVIYRESTDDFRFVIRFTYEPDLWTLTRREPPSTAMFPDSHFSFELFDGPRSLGGISSLDVPSTNMISVYDSSSLVGREPFTLDGTSFYADVPREMFDVSRSDPLVEYQIWVTHENVGQWPAANLRFPVVLNVPEPSTLLIAAGIAPLAGLLMLRRFRRRRQQGP